IVYLAVLGTAWIAPLRPRPRLAASLGLAAAVLATTLGATFGVGGPIPDRLPGNLRAEQGGGGPPRARAVGYANHDYLAPGPPRGADVLGLVKGLRRTGVRKVYWDPRLAGPEHGDFNGAGLSVLARIAGWRCPDGSRAR